MKILISLFLFLSLNTPHWNNNYKDAFEIARKEHKMVLLNFSGSDWCGPCIKLHKDVFTMDEFNNLAEDHLVLVNADFPRAKKNQLSKVQQKLNEELAEKYNAQGDFPLTVLINTDGKVIKAWPGFPASKIDFIEDIKNNIQ
jgi:thioredoxin-related protein